MAKPNFHNSQFLEIDFPDEADTLDRRSLAEGIFVHGVGITLKPQLAVFGQQDLDIQIAEERLVGDIIIAVSHIAVDNQAIYRLKLELRLIFLTRRSAFSVRTDSDTERQYVRQFGEPGVDLARNG